MTDPHVIGVDLGTTHVKAGLFTPGGELAAAAAATYPTTAGLLPTEQDPEGWWTSLCEVVRGVAAHVEPEAVRAIVCVGQGPTLVAVDETYRPLRPAICWNDPRSGAEQAELGDRLGRDGFLLGTLPKILWVRRNEPDLYRRARWFLTPWDYVALRLSGTARTAVTPTSSETNPELVEEAGLDPGIVPPASGWAEPVGQLAPSVAAELGLTEDVVVVSGANDAVGSYVGVGLLEPGQAINTGGTSGGFAAYWHDSLSIPGVYSIPAVIPGLKLFGGAMSATGKSLEWLQEKALGAGTGLEDLIGEAAATPPGAGELVFLPYLNGERSPIWDPDARGAFVGLDVGHGRGHLVRAVLEAAAYAIRHVALPIVDAGVVVDEMRVCGGTARSHLWNQIKADVTGFPVAVPRVLETGTLGAGILAAVGAGLYADVVSAIKAMVRIERRIEPRVENRDVYDALFEVYLDLYPQLAPSFRRLVGEREARTSRI